MVKKLTLVRVFALFVLLTHANSTVFATAQSVSEQDLLRKIDQMIIIGFRGASVSKSVEIQKILNDGNLGGVILFDYDTPTKKYTRNISSPKQLKSLTAELQKKSSTPLFIGIDEEGGKVTRLKSKYGFNSQLPTAKTMSGWSMNYLARKTQKHARYLHSLGINTNFAPVVDTATNPNNPAIVLHNRSFGQDPLAISNKVSTLIYSYTSQNILTSLKHFPGHGSSTTDSHKQFVDITNTHTDDEYTPYTILCGQRAPAVMMGHLFDSNIDPVLPASLSRLHVNKLRSLGCSNQLIISDDYDMRAIRDNYSIDDIVTHAINAGVDVLVFSNNIENYDPYLFFEVRESVLKGVRQGRIPIEAINKSYDKIKLTKQRLGIDR